jgi:hypothetical protein
MSVNQIAAQIKLTEMWKALNDSQYPLRVRRSKIRNRLWNVAPEEIKKVLSFNSAKKIIKAYCKTLPI